MNVRWLMMGIVLLPLGGGAAEPVAMPSTDVNAKHFMPLDAARREAAAKGSGIRLAKENQAFALHSDKAQLNDGFMRIDRARVIVIPSQHAVQTKTASESVKVVAPIVKEQPVVQAADALPGAESIAPESEDIIGNTETNDPVLSLFGSGEGRPLSFRDAMSGKQITSAAGLVRQIGWPIPLDAKQYISSGYGVRDDPFTHRPSFHGGIDIAADEGTAVLATADAIVKQVQADANYGKYITLQHADGTLSRYGHLSAQNVTEGQRVKAGQVVGAVGKTGHATGAHLDYRVSKNGTRFDPLSVLSVPSNVAFNSYKSSPSGVAVRRGSAIASNALPRSAMVIKVR